MKGILYSSFLRDENQICDGVDGAQNWWWNRSTPPSAKVAGEKLETHELQKKQWPAPMSLNTHGFPFTALGLITQTLCEYSLTCLSSQPLKPGPPRRLLPISYLCSYHFLNLWNRVPPHSTHSPTSSEGAPTPFSYPSRWQAVSRWLMSADSHNCCQCTDKRNSHNCCQCSGKRRQRSGKITRPFFFSLSLSLALGWD